MKKNILAVIMLFFLIGSAQTVRATDEFLTAENILKKVDEAAYAKTSQGIMETIIITTGKEKRTLVSEAFSEDGTDKQLTRYLEPARVKGESILMLNDGDDIWYYSPLTDRVRKIASHAKKKKVMGSDFSYEDMASGTMREKYKGKLAGNEKENGRDCLVLALVPKPTGPSYAKIKIWVDKETYVVLRVDYWNNPNDQNPFKRLVVDDIRDIQGHPTPMHYVMKNISEGSETVMNIKEIKYDMDLDAGLFTTRELKKR